MTRLYQFFEDYSDQVPFDQSEVVNDKSYLAPEFFDKEHEQQLDKIDDGIQAAQALDEIKHVYEDDFASESDGAAAALNTAVEALLRRVGNRRQAISTETLKNPASRKQAKRYVRISIEASISGFFRGIIQVIVNIISSIISAITKFFKWITGSSNTSAVQQIQASQEKDKQVIKHGNVTTKGNATIGGITDEDRKKAKESKEMKAQAEKRLVDYYTTHAEQIHTYCPMEGTDCVIDFNKIITTKNNTYETTLKLIGIFDQQVTGILKPTAGEDLEAAKRNYMARVPRYGNAGDEYRLDFTNSVLKVTPIHDIAMPDGIQFTKISTEKNNATIPNLKILYVPKNKEGSTKGMFEPTALWKPTLRPARDFILMCMNSLSPVSEHLNHNVSKLEQTQKQLEQMLSAGEDAEDHAIIKMMHYDISSMLAVLNAVTKSSAGFALLNKYLDLVRDYLVAADNEELYDVVEI